MNDEQEPTGEPDTSRTGQSAAIAGLSVCINRSVTTYRYPSTLLEWHSTARGLRCGGGISIGPAREPALCYRGGGVVDIAPMPLVRAVGGRSLRISIVTISFNQGRFLEQAIQSVVDQRKPGLDIEFVVVDAGSTDNSSEILKAYSDHIDIVIEEPDDGPPDGLNKGFALTTGEVLGFLNADDWLEPGSLSVVADFFRRSAEFDAVVGALEILDERSGATRLVRIPPPFTALRFVEDRTTHPSTSNVLPAFSVGRHDWFQYEESDLLGHGAPCGHAPFRCQIRSAAGSPWRLPTAQWVDHRISIGPRPVLRRYGAPAKSGPN